MFIFLKALIFYSPKLAELDSCIVTFTAITESARLRQHDRFCEEECNTHFLWCNQSTIARGGRPRPIPNSQLALVSSPDPTLGRAPGTNHACACEITDLILPVQVQVTRYEVKKKQGQNISAPSKAKKHKSHGLGYTDPSELR